MESKDSNARYRNLYEKLLHLYPKQFRESYGEGLLQTFNDLLYERTRAEKGLFSFILWTFYDTFAAIISERINYMTLQGKSVMRIIVVTGLILLVPLVAMQFTEEVNWDLFDFASMGILLLGIGFTYELLSKKSSGAVYRAAVAVALGAAFLLIWMNGAVGIIGSENNSANLMYGGVLAIGVFGAFISRFRPRGMTLTLFTMALVQLLVPVIALFAWPPNTTSWGAAGVGGVFLFNGFFAVLFAGSAMLFQRADTTISERKQVT
jgi:hypothetical protein